MNGSEHERARELVLLRDVEGVSDSDAAWLESHIAECRDCAEFAQTLKMTARALRLTPVTASSSLVSATQMRVRQQAAEMREREMRNFFIAISFCIGVLTSGMTSFLWWKFGATVADWLGLPAWIVQPGVFFAWVLPALAVAVVMLASSHPAIDRTVTLAFLNQREGERR